jgi:hypothetical protein
MKQTKAQKLQLKLKTLENLGFTSAESFELFAIERRLNSWFTRECNGEIYRDEKTNKPYKLIDCLRRGTVRDRFPIRDLETAALKKLEQIMSPHRPSLFYYVQPDPRGVCLYIIEKAKCPPYPFSLDAYYDRGVSIYNR